MRVARAFCSLPRFSRTFCKDAKCKEPIKTCEVRECKSVILEAAFNEQINRELQASHEYFNLGQYFYRNSVSLVGFGSHFIQQSREELRHAQLLCKYQNIRDCQVKIGALAEPQFKPESFNTCVREAVEKALKMEQQMMENIQELHRIAGEENDFHAMDFIVKTVMQAQVQEIAEFQSLLAKLGNFEDKIGIFLIDRELREK